MQASTIHFLFCPPCLSNILMICLRMKESVHAFQEGLLYKPIKCTGACMCACRACAPALYNTPLGLKEKKNPKHF